MNWTPSLQHPLVASLLQRWKNTNLHGLRRRLYIYFAVLIFLMLFAVVGLLVGLNIIRISPYNFTQQLQSGLDTYTSNLTRYFSNTAAQGLRFSRLVSAEVEKTLAEKKLVFGEVTGNQAVIRALEENTYSLLRDALLIADCSGAFIIFDATVNPSLADGAFSRCGTYLRLANISHAKEVNPEFVWIRGIHNIGAIHGHTFHNKWELEFSLKRMPFYKKLKAKANAKLTDCYLYTPRLQLSGTWENMVLLCVPIVGSEGEFYGFCGFEISSLYFKLAHPIHAGKQSKVTGLVAYKQGESLLPATGLESASSTGYYAEITSPLRVVSREASGLTTYAANSGKSYVGFEKDIRLSPLDGQEHWVTAILVPKVEYTKEISWAHLKIGLFCAAFLALGLLLSYYLGRIYITPIIEGIESIKKGEAEKTPFIEINDLIEFLSAQDNQLPDTAPAGGQADFDIFQQNVAKLSPAERAVFNLYLESYTAQEIADLLFISINTVKSHNRRIYQKLEVSSRKELLVYAKLLKLKKNADTSNV